MQGEKEKESAGKCFTLFEQAEKWVQEIALANAQQKPEEPSMLKTNLKVRKRKKDKCI